MVWLQPGLIENQSHANQVCTAYRHWVQNPRHTFITTVVVFSFSLSISKTSSQCFVCFCVYGLVIITHTLHYLFYIENRNGPIEVFIFCGTSTRICVILTLENWSACCCLGLSLWYWLFYILSLIIKIPLNDGHEASTTRMLRCHFLFWRCF